MERYFFALSYMPPFQLIRCKPKPIATWPHAFISLLVLQGVFFHSLWYLTDLITLVFVFQRHSIEKCSQVFSNASFPFSFPHTQVECEVPLDLGIPAASIEHQLVVVETEEQLTGTEYCSRFFCFVSFFCLNHFPFKHWYAGVIAVNAVQFYYFINFLWIFTAVIGVGANLKEDSIESWKSVA